MSNLNIDQKAIGLLFTEKGADFLIPDYQRPYEWTEKECQTLWDDLFLFAFPDNDSDKFNTEEEYFLGPIVTFRNKENKKEIIDGQQRLTTLLLLLRAFYERYGSMQTDRAKKTERLIQQCIWKSDEFGDSDKETLKINSEVATDDDKEEFLSILRTGDAVGKKSHYAQNYQFFQKKIAEFQASFPDFFSYLPIRILNNCILLPIEADSQDVALRIFSTLNDRGKPLSDADIFKAQMYKFFSSIGKKDEFIRKWKDLEIVCNDIFASNQGRPIDEIFTRYMYYERALAGNSSSTTEALRKFYEANGYDLLKKESTFKNLIDLAKFWKSVNTQDMEQFSIRNLRRLFVLKYAPNSMWTYFLSVYYMVNRDVDGKLDDDKLYAFLNMITGFIWAYAITNPGVNALRTPIYSEMLNVVKKQPVTFENFKFDSERLQSMMNNYIFSNQRTITKSMVTWWAYHDEHQELLPLETILETEHIFSANRQDKGKELQNSKNLESLGNKALLEKRINIRASDYRFADKKKYYLGFETARKEKKEGTKIYELILFANNMEDFAESDIEKRNKDIIDGFVSFLEELNLTK